VAFLSLIMDAHHSCCEIVANMNGYTLLYNSLEMPLFRFHGVNFVSIRARLRNNEMLSNENRTEVKVFFLGGDTFVFS
jgi:hypothetical protein